MKIREITFHGRQCTQDCSGHRAGYTWAQQRGSITDCSSRSPSFSAGCEVAKNQAKVKQNPKTNQVSEEYELDELIGVKKYQHLTARQIMKKMEDELGLKKLGSGAFGDVIQSPDPNWVFKIVEKDPAYEEYLDHIAKNPNKHFPKIKRIKKMTSFFRRYHVQENKFLVVVIEKLERIPEYKIDFVLELVNSTSVDEVPAVTPDNDYNDNRHTFEEIMQHNWEGWKPNEIAELWEAAQEAHGVSADLDYFLDLHRNNVMQRADGTVVLIDPVASGEGLEYGKAISTARLEKQPMVKGPRYNPELTQATPYDDPYDEWNPHPPNDPGTTAWNRQQQQQNKPLWSNPYGKTKAAFDEWKALFNKTYRSTEEEERFHKLNAYLDQKRKIKTAPPVKTVKPDGINSPSEAQAEFDRIMNKPHKSTADFNRADELNDYLEHEYEKKWKTKSDGRPSHWGAPQQPYIPNSQQSDPDEWKSRPKGK